MRRARSLPLVLAAVVCLTGVSLIGWGALAGDGAAARLRLPVPSVVQPSTVDAAEQARLRQEEAERQAREARQRKERELTVALDEFARKAPDFALALVDNETGQRYAYQGAKRFETASIIKVDILAAVLLRAQNQKRALSASERALARDMIRISDNGAASTLFRTIGRAPGLTAANKRLGLKKTVVNSSWGLTRTTAEDQATLMAKIFDQKGPLDATSRKTLGDLMSSVAKDQRWGVSAAAKVPEKTLLKNGWLSRDTENGLWIINSVGRITGDDVDVSLVILSHGNASYQGGIDTVEKLATLTRQHLDF